MKTKLQKIEKHLNDQLKDGIFKEAYELERVKVALAQRIAEIREDHKLKQSDLATRMRVTQQFISQIESGNTNLTLETLFKLAHSLNINIRITLSDKPSRRASLKVA